MERLRSFFEPDRVALIGATEKIGFGYGQTRTMIERHSGDRLFLINPSQPKVFGRQAYPRISDLPCPVDLAVLIVPSRVVLSVLRECAEKGVKAAIVQSAGFAEIGPEGRRLQRELTDLAGLTGLRIIGPNCVGIANTSNGFTTTETTKEAMRPGPVGIIAQSGVFGNILMDCGPEQGVYFSKVITLGNRCDVDESELIRYLLEDSQTRVIALYLESVQNGRRFMDAVRDVVPFKPVVMIKGGRTPAGKAATQAHTGSLSGEDEIYAGALAQAGVIRARDIQELFDLSKSLATQALPRGPNVAILTTSGSLGAMTADTCMDMGIPLASLSPEGVRTLQDEAPPWMNVKNPLDVGPSGLLVNGLHALMEDPNVDGVIAIFVIPWIIVEEILARGLGPEIFYGDLSKVRQWTGKKPLLFSVVGRPELKSVMRQHLGEDIPICSTPENAARTFAAMFHYGQRLGGG
jgi:acetyltransferase